VPVFAIGRKGIKINAIAQEAAKDLNKHLGISGFKALSRGARFRAALQSEDPEPYLLS